LTTGGNGGRTGGVRRQPFAYDREVRHRAVIPRQIAPSIQAGMRTGLYQLPPDIEDFTGRDDAMRTLEDLFENTGSHSVVSSIAGRAGVGKTALATRVAHRVRESFPNGQLYVNLRGAEAKHMKSSDVLGELLHELGVPRDAIRERLDERIQQYRDQLADRHILLVLDNAAEAAQVRPLLPESPGSAALITSRSQLGELDDNTHEIVLDVLEERQAIELLSKVVGAERVAAEPEAARMIVELCNYLPLAVRIAGVQLPATGEAPLAVLADRLAGEHGRLSELRIRDLEVRASFELNYRGFQEDERRAFRLLGLLRAPDFSPWVVTALLDVELAEADRLIDSLAGAEVLEVARQTPSGQVRYRFHDLLRVFARERMWSEEPEEAQEWALRRVLGTYLALAGYAAGLLEPQGAEDPGDTGRPPVRLSEVAERIVADPATWFEEERIGLIAAVEHASENDLRELTWELARALSYFFKLRTHWTDWQHTQQLALRAARRAQHRPATASALRSLGDVSLQLLQFPAAISNLQRALSLFRQLGDRRGEAWGLLGLGNAYSEQRLYEQALAHLEPALELFRALGDRRGQGWALEGLAVLYRNQGRLDESLARFDEGLALFREVRDRRGEAYCLINLGLVSRDKGEFDSALEWFDQAQPIFQELKDRQGETFILLSKGHILREQGQHEDALACLEGCLTSFTQTGDRAGEAWTRLNRGLAYQALGDHQRALAEFDRSRELFEAKVSDRLGHARALSGCGTASAALGDQASATRMWRAALALFNELGAPESSEIEQLLAG
jgi:tetratricopeptide (TPR) repeat protein